MNISVNCNISLSKKLRAILGKEGSVTLIAPDLKDGKGSGTLSINGEQASIDDSFKGETSIQIEFVGEVKKEVGGEDPSCSNIFTSVPLKGHSEKLVGKIAVVNAPEKSEVSTSIKTREQINSEASIAAEIPPSAKKWISDMEQLIEAVNRAKKKISDVDVSTARTDRERAVLMDMKEKEEAIEQPAWVVNDKMGNVSVNDLGLSLPMNIPFDLSNISARRISASRDLRALIRDGYVRFISSKEKESFIQKAVGGIEGIGELDVYDNHEDAKEALEKSSKTDPVIGEDAIEVSEEDLKKPTEEENTILDLTQNMPETAEDKASIPVAPRPESRRTTHGANPSAPKAQHKPVART